MQWSQQTPSSKNTKEDSTHGHHKKVNIEIRLIISSAAKDGEVLYSQQKEDWELTVAQTMNSFIAKFRLKMKKVGKITRPFRYNLNKIPYDYTVEVTNRFKRLDLIDKGPEELRIAVCNIVQEALIKTIPKKRNAKRPKEMQKGLRRPYK